MFNILSLIQSFPVFTLTAVAAAILLVHVVPYIHDANGIRLYPGPFLAKLSDLWLGWISTKGHRSEVIYNLHEKYGTFVRIAPNHVSVADPSALPIIYGHGTKILKSNFYDAFVTFHASLFSTRDRFEHARKRKFISHIFSPKSVIGFEPQVRRFIELLVGQWDSMFEASLKGLSGVEGEGWNGHDGRLWLDVLPWMNYLAFDIIGDLAFGSPFGMLQAGKDFALVPKFKTVENMMDSYGKEASNDLVTIPAIKIFNNRGEFSTTMGVLPPWLRSIARRLPGYRSGGQAVSQIDKMAALAISKRLANPTGDYDLISQLQTGKDDQGNSIGTRELTGEALTLMIAGSDTTSNTACAVIYYLAGNPRVQKKLQAELDEVASDEITTAVEQVKRLPYLEACINEALRLHSTLALGLPRVVPKGGLNVLGHYFPEGTVLSVPTYSIHRDRGVWGADVESFRPERWLEGDKDAMHKAFNPFSYGPRACIGRNLGFMEQQLIISSLLHRYDFVLGDPNQQLASREGFLRKPIECTIGIKRRNM